MLELPLALQFVPRAERSESEFGGNGAGGWEVLPLVKRAGIKNVFWSAFAGQIALFKQPAHNEVEPVLDVLNIARALHAVSDDREPFKHVLKCVSAQICSGRLQANEEVPTRMSRGQKVQPQIEALSQHHHLVRVVARP